MARIDLKLFYCYDAKLLRFLAQAVLRFAQFIPATFLCIFLSIMFIQYYIFHEMLRICVRFSAKFLYSYRLLFQKGSLRTLLLVIKIFSGPVN